MDKYLNKKTLKKGLEVSLIVSLLTLGGMFLTTINEQTLERVLYVNTFYLVLAVILSLSMWVVGGIRIKLISLGLDEKLSLKSAVGIFLAGAFVSNVTPFAFGGGPAQIFLLHKKGFSLGKATTVIVAQFVLRLLFFGFTAPILFFNFTNLISPGIIPDKIFDIIILVAFFISFFIIYFIWKPKKVKRLTSKLKGIYILKPLMTTTRVNKWIDKLYHEMEEFHNSFLSLITYNKDTLLLTGVFTIIYWGLFFTIAPVILLGLGVEPYFFRSYVVQIIFYLILPYIPTPGASGVAELGFASLFSSFVPAGLVGLLVLVWRFITFYLVLILGGIIFLKLLADSTIKF